MIFHSRSTPSKDPGTKDVIRSCRDPYCDRKSSSEGKSNHRQCFATGAQKDDELFTGGKRGDALECDFKLVWVGKVCGVVQHVDLCDADDTHVRGEMGCV